MQTIQQKKKRKKERSFSIETQELVPSFVVIIIKISERGEYSECCVNTC